MESTGRPVRVVVAAFIVVIVAASNAAADALNVPSIEYPTIQAAIDAAGAGDEIVVAAGIYSEKINFLGKAITVRSADGPDVTTIDGTGLNDSVVKCVSGEGPDTVLRGFTITGGTGEGMPIMISPGGGMLNRNSGPTIATCIFTHNQAVGEGELGGGGGMYNENSNPVVVNCMFVDNESIGIGHGGGMHNWLGSSPTVVSCLFTGNTAVLEGGGMSSFDSSAIVSNCIFWGNLGASGMDESAQIYGTADVTYSLIQGLDTFGSGVGNIDGDPLFVDPGNGDFRLRPGSPCIDAGSTSAFMSTVGSIGLTIDLDGFTRFVDAPATADTGIGLGGVIDMGAYEFGSNPADLDHDGDVDLEDFSTFLDRFTGP